MKHYGTAEVGFSFTDMLIRVCDVSLVMSFQVLKREVVQTFIPIFQHSFKIMFHKKDVFLTKIQSQIKKNIDSMWRSVKFFMY